MQSVRASDIEYQIQNDSTLAYNELQNSLSNLHYLDTENYINRADYNQVNQILHSLSSLPENDDTQNNVFMIDLEDFKDTQYFAKVNIGSSRQPFNVAFDTKSCWSWVPKYRCKG